MTLLSFVEELPDPDRSLAVLNRTEPEHVSELLEATFPEEDVPTIERVADDEDEDVVLLVEDGEVVARSPMGALGEQLLYVNSDIFRTGTRDLEDVVVPDVLLAMDEQPFHLRGYPESDREKLVLITISRLIERRAWEAGEGTLRASFQNLARIEDEKGTYEVYRSLVDTDVDVHLYGTADELPPEELRGIVHAGDTADFRRSWFVLFDPPSSGEDAIALVAYETEPRTWRGFWTYDPVRVQRIERYVEREL
ncbi:sensor protein [Salinarchaeum sp. Harcht-Bsk1]|uniref:DICT sensory domain-containing protein n=1 Tax=Salinarchaeum sp. Harcht-Bsk1 TaxID=1333523 RepID=UPI00034233A0|nr:DICT sensory domain-containing protein [Salinarchaeum sp. Harcht-Bsk1]AGN00018.1 sensor protein [Salinarchaeum sp. Harcht-Bsk1]